MFAVMNLAGYSAPEADDLRKAIAKKLPDKLAKHRQKFVEGSIRNNIDSATANAIFDEWEEFARYGFNKSHAVDYGVIAVQTAYLKLHYTAEYMVALLSVNKSDTAKVALYVADCRRMGIRVEPPDINCSVWDFSLEDQPDGTVVIRFGLGAVKNVGQAPVDVIMKGRAQGAFTDLNDLARRVDLRQVGRRSLECLIKVGALDQFGPRMALLETLDRLASVSASHFKAAEAGQMSLFGAHTGVVEEIHLPKTSPDLNRREILNWERELIGLYITDHPLSSVMETLAQAVTHFSGQLSEAQPQERVRVAGIITKVRPHQSKAGKPMGFVTIEDLQGSVELVVFPKCWEKYADLIRYDQIILVEGKADLEGTEPKVLVDTVSTEFDIISPLVGTPPTPENSLSRVPAAQRQPAPADLARPAPVEARNSSQIAPPPVKPAPSLKEDFDYSDENWEVNLPPPPDEFPEDWVSYDGSPVSEGLVEPGPELIDAVQSPLDGLDMAQVELPGLVQAVYAEMASEVISEVVAPTVLPPAPASTAQPNLALDQRPVEPVAEPEKMLEPVQLPRYLVPPTVVATEDGLVHMITVLFRTTGDKTRDVLRLRRIHGIITSYPGNDRFAFHVFERGRGYLLEFPNFTIGYSPELVSRLSNLIGSENIRVEKITFQ